MSGRSAALKVAARNALHNRRRTVSLVLLVAAGVALGVLVGGVTRASTLTPEERAQLEFGTADAKVDIVGDDGALAWVYDRVGEIDTSLRFTEYRRTGITLPDFQFGVAYDLDMRHPLTEGMLVLLEGETPDAPGETALSPEVAHSLGAGVGDQIDLKRLGFDELEVVGMVSAPLVNEDSTIVLWPGALKTTSRSTTVLLAGDGAEAAAMQIQDLWWAEGRDRFLPDPAVDQKPVELEVLHDDLYRLLTEAQIETLVGMAQSESGAGAQRLIDRAYEMVEPGRRLGTANVNVETRTRYMSQGGLERNPALLSTVASSVVLIEVAFITGAAFAAGTRRRLREIGLLGANGASDRHVRTAVIGEGLTIGLIGATTGVVLGIAVLVLGRPLLQRFVTRLLTGIGVNGFDLLGPVLVALASVLIAVWIPARTASKIPITIALQGRMPASPPRRWVLPVGLAASGVGAMLITVALASTSRFSPVLVGIGSALVVGGIAMLASPILAVVSKLSDYVPITGRLVLRDSGRHRTRSSVAVAAIMVILLAPVILVTMAEMSRHQNLLYGLPEPSTHLLVSGVVDQNESLPTPLDQDDIAEVARIVPAQQIATFETLDLHARTEQQLEIEASDPRPSIIRTGPDTLGVGIANESLLIALGDRRIEKAVTEGRIVLLGVDNKETTVSINFEEKPALELAVPVLRHSMPRVLLPPSHAATYSEAESRPIALFVLARPLTDQEHNELSLTGMEVSGGRATMSNATSYMIAGGITLLAVLIVIALVTAVSAAELDEELRTIVSVGATSSFRKRFLGLLTAYQTLVAAFIAIPLGLGLIKVFASAREVYYEGPFGQLATSAMFPPWTQLAALAVATPVTVGLLTWLSVRSAPVTPPRRAT